MMKATMDDGGATTFVGSFSNFLADGRLTAAAIGRQVRQDMEQKEKEFNN
jgi:hypothetical protein